MAGKSDVWLGTPTTASSDSLRLAFTSRIGGTGVLFCDAVGALPFICPRCRKAAAVSLLAQLYAPLDVYDRVIYILICGSCSGEDSSFCFAVRSQNFNPAYVIPSPAAMHVTASNNSKGALFEEDENWDDDCDNEWGVVKESSAENRRDVIETNGGDDQTKSINAEVLSSSEKLYPPAPPGSKLPVQGKCYPCFGLDIFLEPAKTKCTPAAVNSQLREALQKYGEDVVDVIVEDDDIEPPHEKRQRKYVEKIGQVPSQCVRWSPGKEPLRSSVAPIDVPNCPLCGAERRYELQLTSPIIYFLTKDDSKKNSQTLHFGNVLVFSCSANCGTAPYAREHCVVEEEI